MFSLPELLKLLFGRSLTDATLTSLWSPSSRPSQVKPISDAVLPVPSARNGDLAYRTYLQVTLPEINQNMNSGGNVYARWLDYVGEQLVAQVEVEIGGQRIDRQYGDWMHIWNQMTLSSEQQRGYFKMIGNTTQLTYITEPDSPTLLDLVLLPVALPRLCAPRNALPETTLYVPLHFWFCRNPGLALPLIALQYHEVKINIDSDLLVSASGL